LPASPDGVGCVRASSSAMRVFDPVVWSAGIVFLFVSAAQSLSLFNTSRHAGSSMRSPRLGALYFLQNCVKAIKIINVRTLESVWPVLGISAVPR